MNAKTARALKSAARWLSRRAKKRTATTKAAYREAIDMINKLAAPAKRRPAGIKEKARVETTKTN
jgi:hypothetical protein